MKKKLKTTILEYLIVAFGTFLVAFALQFFFFPNKIASGGVTGLALIISSIFHISSSLIVTIANVILFSIAFILISGEFGIKSIYAAGLLSIFLAILENFFGNVVITNDLVLLEDDKHLFPPYQAAPLIREEIVKKYPEIVKSLNKLSDKIDTKEMIKMNYLVEVEGKSAKEVALEYLKYNNLLDNK